MRLERLSQNNFKDFESLTNCDTHPACYCAFWHQKWASVSDWDERKKTNPEANKITILDRLKSGFHVGALAYRNEELVGWVSVAPVPEFYWAWRRLSKLGDSAKNIACITCVTVAPKLRSQGLQSEILKAVIDYSKTQGWSQVEGYPFDPSAFEKHGKALSWAGHVKGYADAGFQRIDSHWLSNPDYERSIYAKII